MIHETPDHMNQDPPPELKGHHLRTMWHAGLVLLIPIVCWLWAYHRQENFAAEDDLQTVLHWIFLIGVGAFMATILIKALVSLPQCPECRRTMREISTIEIADKPVLKIKSSSTWRIV
jgi:hypothetical protein